MSEHIQELAEHLEKVFMKATAGDIDMRNGFLAIAKEIYSLPCEVWSPDRLPLLPEPHENIDAAIQCAAGWFSRFVRQGYYLNARQERLSLDTVLNTMSFRFSLPEPEEDEG